MSIQNTAPDFGEPWEGTMFRNCIRDRHNTLRQIEDDLRDRARVCVNACQGMADPAAEITHLRDYAGRTHELATQVSVVVAQHEAKQEEIDEMRERLNSLEFRLAQEKHLNTDHEQDYLAVWKLIKKPDETVVQAAQRLKSENEAVRAAIVEAHEALSRVTKESKSRDGVQCGAPSMVTMYLRAEIVEESRSALAKLQPFLRP